MPLIYYVLDIKTSKSDLLFTSGTENILLTNLLLIKDKNFKLKNLMKGENLNNKALRSYLYIFLYLKILYYIYFIYIYYI